MFLSKGIKMNIFSTVFKFKKLIIAVLIFIFCALGLNIYRIQGDGDAYFAVTEAVLHIPDPESAPNMRNAYFFSAGCAFFNVPFYLSAYAVEKTIGRKLDFNGITLRSASINIASNFYMILAIILAFQILKLLNLRYMLVSILGILFSTSAFTVSVIMPSYAHAVDIFLITLFIYLILKYSEGDLGGLFWVGALYPVMVMVRYFNFVLIIPLFIRFILEKEYKKIGRVVLGILLTIWIFPLVFIFYSHGTVLSKDNFESIIRFPLFPKYALKLLVHPIHGLFVWSPVVILSMLGLIKMTDTNKKKNAYVLLGIWALLVFIYGFFCDWHAGWSFSNRYLVGLFPVYVIGLAYFLDRYGKWAAVLSVLAA